jgi:hypothetical protein
LSAKQLIEYLAVQHKFDEVDRAKVKSLYVTLDEGRFFLPLGVRDFLVKLSQTSEAFLQVLADRSNLNVDDQEAWRSTADEAAALNARLREMYADLPRAFEEALAFKHIERG